MSNGLIYNSVKMIRKIIRYNDNPEVRILPTVQVIMKNITILMISKSRLKKDILILIISIATIYLLISLYFINHCLPNTSLNGANISFMVYSEGIS